MRFDWEPRATAEGLLQIHRNQKRESSDQGLKEYTSQSRADKCRAQWEEASQGKAQLVASTLREEPWVEDKNASPGPPTRSLPVADILKQDLEEKQALKAAEKQLAAVRREALLQQAATIAAERDSRREAQVQEHKLTVLKNRDPEVRECIRKLRDKELAAEWEQHQKEKLILIQKAKSANDPKSTSSCILPGGLTTVLSREDKKHTQKNELSDLKLQIKESQRRKAEERSENAAMEAALRQQWDREEAAAVREEQEKMEIQREFLKSAEITREWQTKQASKRAMAEAKAEKRLVTDIKLQQQQETAKHSSAKIKLREDAERELINLTAKSEDRNTRIEAEKRSERLRLAQEAQKHAESAKEQTLRRQQQAHAILKVNQALIEVERVKKQALTVEDMNIRRRMGEIALESGAQKAASKQAQRAEAVRISTQLAAQIAAKKVRAATQSDLEKTHEDEQRAIEEERRRLVAEAIAAYKNLK
ncbi:hypothetical protein NADE_003364 [Nannochloris sp. 'desiccata']|nr:hypothetical protein KSW81_000604 [Chlorella desiccata (nom. nud.)]KAH7620751.1 hypothetical protein NADE_003364 [Chlorella desiccata (nom. nud.)]